MTINAWSYSRLKDYEICPRFAFYAHSSESEHKELRTFGPPAARGIKIHNKGEKYLKGGIDELPEAYGYVAEQMTDLKERKAIAEEGWAFTDEWHATGWMAKDTWLRMKIDAQEPEPVEYDNGEKIVRIPKRERKRWLRIVDFKTGRIYQDHPQQLELYALAAMKVYPGVRNVAVENWYLDIGEIHAGVVKRDEEPDLTEQWTARAEKMLNAKAFPATPCWKCKWCDFNATKGGPCTEGRKG